MPIPVTCPDCSAHLNAPDGAAGRQVNCPKCRAAIAVPAARAVFDTDDMPEPTRRRIQRHPDDGPQGGESPGRSGRGIPPIALYGGITAAVLIAVSLGLGVASRVEQVVGLAAKTVDLPAGWKEFVSAEDGFKAYFPDTPKTGAKTKAHHPIAGGARPDYRPYTYSSHPQWPYLRCEVRVYELPDVTTPQQQNAFADLVCTPAPQDNQEQEVGSGAAKLAGLVGKEVVTEQSTALLMKGKPNPDGRIPTKTISVGRWVVTGDHCYHLRVFGRETQPKEAAAFFAHFSLTAADSGSKDAAKPAPPRPGG
jgi:hypothetical protein